MLTKKISKIVYEFTCTDCAYKFESDYDFEPIVCPMCQKKAEPLFKTYKYKSEPNTYPNQNMTYTTYTDVDPCLHCSNNPKNGGSGVCNCSLPSLRRGW